MRRAAMLTLISLVVFFFLPRHSASAQHNCFIAINHVVSQTGTTTRYYRAVIGSTVITNVEAVTVAGSGTFTISLTLTVTPGVSGINNADVQVSTAPDFSSFSGLFYGSFSVNCTNNNREFGGGCGVLGVDIAGVDLGSGPAGKDATVTLYVFGPSGQVVFEKSYSGPPRTKVHIQEPLPAAFDHTATYSYRLDCTAGQCGGQGTLFLSAPAVLLSGPLNYICPPPCGPSLDGAPLGRMLTTTPLHWAPRADSASTFRAEAGKTFKIIGSRDGFTRIALACQAYWVPSGTIAQCADPLCRD